MRIVMFSITPLFPAHDLGGAQKHLRAIALHLAAAGHEVTVLCTARADTPIPFRWHANALVKPILPFKQPFPHPYDTGAHNLAVITQIIGDHLAAADRFYIHDGEWTFSFSYPHVPTVASLRDNSYPETAQGAFQFRGQTLIVPSDYSRKFYLQTAGRFFPELAERLKVIPNGMDWTRFRYTAPRRIFDLIPVDPARHTIILHPHRPEAGKGAYQTLDVAERLVRAYGMTALRVLMPKWVGTDADPGVSAFYAELEAEIVARGLREHFIFHAWIPADLMAEYYSLGRVTLVLGGAAEAFGNTAYESLGCGTPSIIARVSSQRDILPETLIDKVDFDDADAAARAAADILRTGRRTSEATMRYLHTHYRAADQLAAFAETILSAQAVEAPRYVYTPITERTRFILPVWCWRGERGIYHDYRAAYVRDAALERLIDAHPDGFSFADADSVGSDPIMAWYRAGLLVPIG
jgi:glycosyltransferase involved in cell wall biosynthesis